MFLLLVLFYYYFSYCFRAFKLVFQIVGVDVCLHTMVAVGCAAGEFWLFYIFMCGCLWRLGKWKCAKMFVGVGGEGMLKAE